MPSLRMRRSLAVAAACLSLTVAACTPVEKKKPLSEEQASTNVCDQLALVEQALAKVSALKPTSTVGDAETAGKDLRQALKGLSKAENTLEAMRVKDFQKQAKAFSKELKAMTKEKDTTLEAAAAALQPKAAPVIAAHKALKAAVKCDAPAAAAGGTEAK